MEHMVREPWLFLEPDAVPLKPGWLDILEAEFRSTKKPLMGAFVPSFKGSPDHMSGVAIWPWQITTYCGEVLFAEDIPFDLIAAEKIVRQAHFTDKIQHKWMRDWDGGSATLKNEPAFTSLEDFRNNVTSECVLFHSDRSWTLPDLLRSDNLPVPVLAEPQTSQKRSDEARESTNSSPANPVNGVQLDSRGGQTLNQERGDVKCPESMPQEESILSARSSSGTEKVQPSSVPWKNLSKAEQKLRRQAQATKMRAAKAAKRKGREVAKPTETKVSETKPVPEESYAGSNPAPSPISETDTCREILAPYCSQRLVLDIGFGGSAIVPHALTFDMEWPYTSVGKDKQILKGDCRNLSMFCDESLDVIYSAHVLEDFSYPDLINIIREWRRVLKTGGLLVTNCPDQQKFLAHCAKTGQGTNAAHVEQDFSLLNFRTKVLINTDGYWEHIFEEPNHGPYSFLIVCKKI